MKIIKAAILVLFLAFSVKAEYEQAYAAASLFATDRYASASGTGAAPCTNAAARCSLQTAIDASAATDTVWMDGGTYTGKFYVGASGITMRSDVGEWAVLNGYKTTTLASPINSTDLTITLGSTEGLFGGMSIAIDTEIINIATVVNSTTMTINPGVGLGRGWGGSIGGAASHAAGTTVYHTGNQLQVAGSNNTFRDFEIRNSFTQRDMEPSPVFEGQGCCGFYEIVRGSGVSQTGPYSNNSYINLIVRDNINGFFIGSATSNTTIIGCLIYDNGGHYYDSSGGREQGSGIGTYLENASGYSRVYGNVIFNNFNSNGQYFGVSGPYVGGDLQDNVFANAGSPLGGIINPNIRNFNILYGPDSVASPTANIDENFFYAPHTAVGGTPARIGFGAGITNATVTNNWFIGGPSVVGLGTVGTVTFTGNKLWGKPTVTDFIFSRVSSSWNNNTYYEAQGRSVFHTSSYQNFAGWQSGTGYDASSTQTSTAPSTTVSVWPNPNEAGKCRIAVVAPSNPSSVNVDLSTCGLANGQTYRIRNAFNIDGSNVSTGAFSSGASTVSVPLTGAAQTVATPVGMAYTPATTAPDLYVLLVEPTSAAAVCRRFRDPCP